MHLTQYTDYALRVLIYLTVHRDEVVTIRDVGEAYGISQHHLAKVVQRLGQRGYVDVRRGRGGGMSLAQEPGAIQLDRVVADFESDLALVECFEPESDNCRISPVCALKGVLEEARSAFFDVLASRTLADMVGSRAAALRRALTR